MQATDYSFRLCSCCKQPVRVTGAGLKGVAVGNDVVAWACLGCAATLRSIIETECSRHPLPLELARYVEPLEDEPTQETPGLAEQSLQRPH